MTQTSSAACSSPPSPPASARPAPSINYHALSPPDAVARTGVAPAIAVEELRAQAPYDQRRIVYRTSPYQLSYYEYDQWAAAPGVLVAEYLRRAYQASGRFGLVLPQPGTDTTAILGRPGPRL